MSAYCFKATRGDNSESVDVLQGQPCARETYEQGEKSRRGKIHGDGRPLRMGAGGERREARSATSHHGTEDGTATARNVWSRPRLSIEVTVTVFIDDFHPMVLEL